MRQLQDHPPKSKILILRNGLFLLINGIISLSLNRAGKFLVMGQQQYGAGSPLKNLGPEMFATEWALVAVG